MTMRNFLPLAAALSMAGILSAPMTARAQDAPPPVTIDLKDAPIRSALEQIFNAANVQYFMDNQVQGFVTLKIRDQPFENALKLIMRSSSVPLTYTKEGGVYLVKPRPQTPPPTSDLNAPEVVDETPTSRPPDIITLSYIDALDLDQLLGPFLYLRPFQRQMQSGGGGMGGGMGGMGGGMGGMGGGMGGMGGGMGGMGGGMGGMGGGMGGMGGGMGGMGGGMGGMGGGMGGMGGGMGGMGGGGFGGGRGF